MEELKQENHELKQKLKLAYSMEASYLDEIDQLKLALKAAAIQTEENTRQRKSPDASYNDELFRLEDRAVTAERHLSEALEQLELGRQRQAELMERIPVNISSPELSISRSVEHSLPDPLNFAHEIGQLQEELASSEAGRSKIQRKLVEAEEECLHLRNYTDELERHLKSVQGELGDVRAELDAARMLANSTDKSRGNSVFSELEDRRIRAEQLVVKQRQRIDELELASRKTQAEWKHKLAETIQRLDVRARERDTQLLHELTSERERLLEENAKLKSQIEHMQDLQLDNERSAVKVSKAFQLEENSQSKLIKALEGTAKRLERELTEKSASEESLRNRLLSSAAVRRRLRDQLWQQSDVNVQLTRLVEDLKRSQHRNSRSDENTAPPGEDQVKAPTTTEGLQLSQPDTYGQQQCNGIGDAKAQTTSDVGGPQPTHEGVAKRPLTTTVTECNPS